MPRGKGGFREGSEDTAREARMPRGKRGYRERSEDAARKARMARGKRGCREGSEDAARKARMLHGVMLLLSCHCRDPRTKKESPSSFPGSSKSLGTRTKNKRRGALFKISVPLKEKKKKK